MIDMLSKNIFALILCNKTVGNVIKGLGSLTINFCPANMKKNYKGLQNITMVTKYNLFTVNKWILTTLKSIMYHKNLTFSLTLLSKLPIVFHFCDVFA